MIAFFANDRNPASVTDVCMEMSPAFVAGVERYLSEAAITFDRFHVMQLAGQTIDQVRRDEQKTVAELKRSRYLWLKNPATLKGSERDRFADLSRCHLKTVRAWNLRMSLRALWDQHPDDAGGYLTRWYRWAIRSRLFPEVDHVRSVQRHWHVILHTVISGVTNGVVEGINSIIQRARSRARGYRSVRNSITMRYLVAGKLLYDLPI